MRRVVFWDEPNRADTPPLHIASRGSRYSSVTGVSWLDHRRYVANHRSGLRLALFDLECGDEPVHKVAIPHLTDAVSVSELDGDRWLAAVSGCWAADYSLYELGPNGFSFLETVQESRFGRTFAHGMAFGPNGELVISYHTGASPRVGSVRENKTWHLPAPWGARDGCFNKSGDLYVVANTTDPSETAYADTSAAVWKLEGDEFRMLVELPGAHYDCAAIYGDRLYATNQHDDNIPVFDLKSERQIDIIEDEAFSFPHGVDISPNGVLAVTNYGNSSIVLRDL